MKSVHLQRVDLNLIKVFSAIYKERHVTRAGLLLHMSQSAVSHGLRNLRAAFDDPLFVRTPEGMEPTAFADRLADRIRGPLDEIEAAFLISSGFDPATAEMDIALGVTTEVHPEFIAGLCRTVRERAPNARLLVRLLSINEVQDVLDAKSVQLVVADPQSLRETRRFGYQPLFESEVVCVVATSNVAVGAVLDLQTYAALPHLVVAADKFGRTWVDDQLAEQGLERRVTAIVPSAVYINQIIPGSPLVCTIMGNLVAPSPDIRVMAPPIAGRLHTFGLIWHTRDDAHAPLAWLRELVAGVWRTCAP